MEHLEYLEDAVRAQPPIGLVENILRAGQVPQQASGGRGESLDVGQLHPGALQVVVGGGERLGPLGIELRVRCGFNLDEADRSHDGVADDEAADSDLREHELDQLAAARLHLLAGVHLGAAAPGGSAAHRRAGHGHRCTAVGHFSPRSSTFPSTPAAAAIFGRCRPLT
jgi:hypothetical protein